MTIKFKKVIFPVILAGSIFSAVAAAETQSSVNAEKMPQGTQTKVFKIDGYFHDMETGTADDGTTYLIDNKFNMGDLVKVTYRHDDVYQQKKLTGLEYQKEVLKHSFIEGYQNGYIESQTKPETVFNWIGNAVHTLKNIF